MKIIFLINDFNIKAGWGRMAHDLIQSIKESGIDTETFTYNDQIFKHPILNFFKIRRILKKFDIIHALDGWPLGAVIVFLSLGLGKKVIITTQGTHSVRPLYQWPKKLILSWAYKKANKVVAVSSYISNEIKKVLPGLEIEIINHGVYYQNWQKKIPSSPDILGLKPYVLSVGAVKPRKGYHNSITAFLEIAGEFPNLNYIIVGSFIDDNYTTGLKKIISDNNLEGRVILKGQVSEEYLAMFYQNAELFILTPKDIDHNIEGFGMVYLEAAACGLPVIGSLNSGAGDAIKNNFNGLLVDSKIEAISDTFKKLLGSNELKEKFSKNSLIWAKENDWKNVGDKYINLYKNILKT